MTDIVDARQSNNMKDVPLVLYDTFICSAQGYKRHRRMSVNINLADLKFRVLSTEHHNLVDVH